MKQSFTKNYLKIYAWQILALVLNLLSLFIVVPHISENKYVYGIYTICISSIIFLSYADFGFVNAGFKYASEYYARKEHDLQVKTVGFISFLLLVFALLFASIIVYLSFNPALIINDIGIGKESEIARSLLLILAFFSPNIVLQRALQIIYGIRLEDYILQKVLVCINLLKIAAVYLYFGNNRYDIVSYFLTTQALTSSGLIIAFLIASRKYNIGIMAFLKSIRFSRQIFNITKSLAISSFFMTISWIVFYELDPYVIVKFSAPETVAYYSIGLTCLSFFRTILGTLFNPFSARFNHLIAVNDENALRLMFKKVMSLSIPVVVFPTLAVCILSKPFIYSWVGSTFAPSLPVVQLLAACNILAFIAYPCGILLTARKKITSLYVIAALQPLIYWSIIFFRYTHTGFEIFAISKFSVFIINGLIYAWLATYILNIKPAAFFREIILPAVLPTLILILMLYGIREYLPASKNHFNLIIVISAGGAVAALATITYYFTSPAFKIQTTAFLQRLGGKN